MIIWLVSHPSGQVMIAVVAAIISTYIIDRIKRLPIWSRLVWAAVVGVFVLVIPVQWIRVLGGQLTDTYEVKGWFSVSVLTVGIGLWWLSFALAKSRVLKHHQIPQENGPEVALAASSAAEALSKGDIETLQEIASRFRGRAVYTFLQDLGEYRSVDLDAVAKLEANIKRYSAPDKVFLSAQIEGAKQAFFHSLDTLLDFASAKFSPVGGGKPVFYGEQRHLIHTSPRLREQFVADEAKLVELVRSTNAAWAMLVRTALKWAPGFHWPD